MAKLNRFTGALWDLETFHDLEDFKLAQSDLNWVDVITDSGTVLQGSTPSGVAVLTPSDGTIADNDEAYLAEVNALWQFIADRPLYGRFRIKYAETVSGTQNVAVGFTSVTVAADMLADNGGGPVLTGSHLWVFKVDGGTVWKMASATNGVSTVSTSTKTATPAEWHDIQLELFDYESGNGIFTATVDGEPLRDANGFRIRHAVPIASSAAMRRAIGVKLGAGTNNDTLQADFAYGAQKRALTPQ